MTHKPTATLPVRPYMPASTLGQLAQLAHHRQPASGLLLTTRTGVHCAPMTPMDTATTRAARLTADEVAQVMERSCTGLAEVNAGRGLRWHWMALCSAMHVGRGIESLGVVRGLSQHFDAAEEVLNAIADRAGENDTPPTWRSPALRAAEMDQLRLLVDLHDYQLRQVSYGEYQRAYTLATARVLSEGGKSYGGNV